VWCYVCKLKRKNNDYKGKVVSFTRRQGAYDMTNKDWKETTMAVKSKVQERVGVGQGWLSRKTRLWANTRSSCTF
jgi:hypothetical protein